MRLREIGEYRGDSADGCFTIFAIVSSRGLKTIEAASTMGNGRAALTGRTW